MRQSIRQESGGAIPSPVTTASSSMVNNRSRSAVPLTDHRSELPGPPPVNGAAGKRAPPQRRLPTVPLSGRDYRFARMARSGSSVTLLAAEATLSLSAKSRLKVVRDRRPEECPRLPWGCPHRSVGHAPCPGFARMMDVARMPPAAVMMGASTVKASPTRRLAERWAAIAALASTAT